MSAAASGHRRRPQPGAVSPAGSLSSHSTSTPVPQSAQHSTIFWWWKTSERESYVYFFEKGHWKNVTEKILNSPLEQQVPRQGYLLHSLQMPEGWRGKVIQLFRMNFPSYLCLSFTAIFMVTALLNLLTACLPPPAASPHETLLSPLFCPLHYCKS